jgi:hypothetical protein
VLDQLGIDVSGTERDKIARKNESDNPQTALDNYKLLLQSEGLEGEESASPPAPKPGATPERGAWLSPGALGSLVASLLRPLPVRADNAREEEVRKLLEQYRDALERADLATIAVTKGDLSPKQREGLELYFRNAGNLKVKFEDITIAPIDPSHFLVSYLRRDDFEDRRTGERVSLEVRLQDVATLEGEQWRLLKKKSAPPP